MNFWIKRPVADLAVSLVLAIVVFNVHVSTAGDALWSVERSDRHLFYVGLALLAAAFMIASIIVNALRPIANVRAGLGALGFMMIASLAGVLLDVQDGPVRTIQLLVLFALFLGLLAIARLVVITTRTSTE